MKNITAPRNLKIKGQDHMLAYITAKEAEALKARGGSGRMTKYGVRSYEDGDGGGNGDSSGQGGGDGSNAADGIGADTAGPDTSGLSDAIGQGFGPESPGYGFSDPTAGFGLGPDVTAFDQDPDVTAVAFDPQALAPTAPTTKTAPTVAVNPFDQTFHAALDFQGLQAVTPGLSPAAAPSPFGTQGFGQAPSALGMGAIGTMAGLGLGVPGLGMIGTAIGAGLDAKGLNEQLESIGLLGNIDRDQAVLSAMSLGALGVSARDQFAQAMGFPSYDQSPMSSLNQQQGLPDAPADTSGDDFIGLLSQAELPSAVGPLQQVRRYQVVNNTIVPVPSGLLG